MIEQGAEVNPERASLALYRLQFSGTHYTGVDGNTDLDVTHFLPELLWHASQQNPIREESNALSDIRFANRLHDVQQGRVKKRLTASQAKRIGMIVPAQD
jgi:hypothetical protein